MFKVVFLTIVYSGIGYASYKILGWSFLFMKAVLFSPKAQLQNMDTSYSNDLIDDDWLNEENPFALADALIEDYNNNDWDQK